MNKDQGVGVTLLAGSVLGVVIYAWLLYTYAVWVLQITAFVAVAAVLVILAWIGWTMATTPPPAPFEPEPSSTQAAASTDSEAKPPETTDKP
jgi:predicted DNA-binding transcriptional regulator